MHLMSEVLLARTKAIKRSSIQQKRSIRSLQSFSQHGRSHISDNSQKQAILFLSSASWPEPNATAAGARTNSLLDLCLSSTLFTSIHFGCGATFPRIFNTKTHDQKHVQWHQVKLNKENEMKLLLGNIQQHHGQIKAVVFDRFYAEEAYSFIIKEVCPDALRILDMQDVHSLRIGRQSLVQAFDRELSSQTSLKLTSDLMKKVMTFDPKDNYQEADEARLNKQKAKSYDTFLRELASIHRSDMVLVCSSPEMELLSSWRVPRWKMALASFFCDIVDNEELPTCSDRCDFVTVGG